jgi:hypothetical protein
VHALGAELVAAICRARTGITAALRRRLVAQVRRRPGVRITLHASADPWATGSFAWSDSAHGCDAVVASCWTDATGEVVRSLDAIRGDARVGGYLRPDTSSRPAAELIGDHVAAGLDELHLYHLGLVGHEGLRRLAGYAAAFRAATSNGIGSRG